MPKIPVLIILCFRPLSGNYISQFFVLSPMGKLGQGFRPLSGNYISQSDIHELYYYKYKRFRPLSGNYISQYFGCCCSSGFRSRVSVPCRGTTFLNKERNVSMHIVNRVSVPCRGTTFLNGIHTTLAVLSLIVSVPCRGTTFLNTIPAIPPPVWAHGRDCVGKIFLEK